MEIPTAEELKKFTQKIKAQHLKEKISKDYMCDLIDSLYDTAQTSNCFVIDKENYLYSGFNHNVREYLELLGYKVIDNYGPEEYDYEFYGYVISW